MRLINTQTLELQEFYGSDTLRYAILSHRWGENEVGYKDFVKKRITTGAGYRKIVECCAFALSRHLRWVWIDTCCIDKRSSSELSEAINSMYRWYADAEECYAYLADVDMEACRSIGPSAALAKSSWFSRGWTLQELIAPSRVIFLDIAWRVLGQKYSLSPSMTLQDPRTGDETADLFDETGDAPGHLFWVDKPGLELGPCLWPDTMTADALEEVTSIPRDVLLRPATSLRFMSIATRMSWMERRRTTRIEDEAYCLLGIFGVNMPLLYGEGSKAFERLQIELLRSSNDESIFAWDKDNDLFLDSARLLAPSPNSYDRRWSVERDFWYNTRRAKMFTRTPYDITNAGLRFEIPEASNSTYRFVDTDGREAIMVALNCLIQDAQHRELGFMVLKRVSCGHYVRKRTKVEDVRRVIPQKQLDWIFNWPNSTRTFKKPDARRFKEPEESSDDEPYPLAPEKLQSSDIYIHFGNKNHDSCDITGDELIERGLLTPIEQSLNEILNDA